ncbi:MAG: GtrA family protein [Candidatus Peregrinibacteria bacterium]|nr:GtrA family protein [Candidatus Peregrinibacteria bacterium]
MLSRLRPYLHQFLLYLMSGGIAVLLDFGSYFLLLSLDVWYVTANIVGNVLGFFGAFVLHKYLVFQKREAMINHFVRYCIINVFNILAQTAILYLLVERLHLDEGSAKFVSWAVTVLWNFFLYKFFVYV